MSHRSVRQARRHKMSTHHQASMRHPHRHQASMRNPQRHKASTQAKTSGASAKCLHDWLVEEGYMGKLEVVGGQSIFSMRSIPADVESKLAQGKACSYGARARAQLRLRETMYPNPATNVSIRKSMYVMPKSVRYLYAA